jgi:primosomal protein N''
MTGCSQRCFFLFFFRLAPHDFHCNNNVLLLLIKEFKDNITAVKEQRRPNIRVKETCYCGKG